MRFHPFVFTGKELDEETGYGYFGARYMDHELMTGWLSVDPMADKYPSMSPYNYCAWNPVKLVDPDGREIENPSFWGKCIVLAAKILSKDFRIRYNDLVKSKEIYVINPNDKGTNNLIKCIKRIAFGYRRYDHFIARIFLIKGIIKE